MTTSWAHTLRGNFEEAIRANIGGFLLCVLAVFSIPICCMLVYSGRASRYGWFSKTAISWMILALILATIDWIIRIAA